MKYKLSYIPLIWITTVILGSLNLYLVSLSLLNGNAIFGGTFSELLKVYFLTLGNALLFSPPTVLVLWLAMFFLVKTKLSTINIKGILASVGMCLLALTFVLGGNGYAFILILPWFAIVLVFSVYFFKLRN